jgi:hypothetical protein
MAPPGVNTADVNVYDVPTKVADLSVTADVIRFQADSGTMQGMRLFVVNNTSSPAKTQMNDHNFEFYLPAGAKVEQVQARAPNGQPIPAEAVPQAEKNRYAIAFPLRPGETQFQVEFTLPYSGEIKIDPKPLYPAAHLVIVLPKTMQFKAANPPSFQSMQDPSQGDSNVEVAQQTKPGQPLGLHAAGQRSDHRVARRHRLGRGPAAGSAASRTRQSAGRRTRRPHRRARCSAEISLADPLRIRRAARHRRLGGHETAARNLNGRNLRREAWRGSERPQHSAPSNPASVRDQRSSREIVDAARSIERRTLPTRGRKKTRQDHTRGLRKSQSSPRPNPRPRTEAARLRAVGTGALARPSRARRGGGARQLPVLRACPETKARAPHLITEIN